MSSSGRTIKTAKGYTAFLPNPLPPEIEWSNALVNALSQADVILGQLSRATQQLPNPQLIIKPSIIQEAVSSSNIEGTQVTSGEMFMQAAQHKLTVTNSDIPIVQQYVEALDYGVMLLKEMPLSLRFIKLLHFTLMKNEGSHLIPGEFRRSQNWIGAPGCSLNTAKYVPPPPELLMDVLHDLELFLHDQQLPGLIHIALCHYQFEAIHPFLDGNGRIGRLLITLLLISKEILPQPMLYLSRYFEANRNEYYRQLNQVSSSGMWEDWLIYFLTGVVRQSKYCLSRCDQLNQLIDSWRVQLNNRRLLVAIIEEFVGAPYQNTQQLAANLAVVYSTVQRGLDKLIALQMIEQVGDQQRNKVYCAPKILAILAQPDQSLDDF